MSRSNNGALIVALTSVILGAGLVACNQTPPALDLTTVPACPAEDGPGMSGPVPCVWDSAYQGNGHGGSVVRWYLYADTCPRTTVQDHRLVECIGRADWTGGVEGEGRSNN